jgi:glycosyltransferase involved in cell wall biosynthesis
VSQAPLRLAVYTDYAYRRADDGAVYADRAFVKFVIEMERSLDKLVLLGRTDPEPGRSHYRLPPEVQFVPLPHYPSLNDPLQMLGAIPRSLVRFWKTLDDVDAAWLLGPYLLAILFALLARLKGKPVVLGVRQDLPRYVATRHPGRRLVLWAAIVLEKTFRALARRLPVVVVGPDLAQSYRRACALLPISVSLVTEQDLARQGEIERTYDGDLQILAVGRLETEKNPLLLADVLALLREDDPRWTLVVCGEGHLESELADRLATLGLEQFASLRGYVPIDGGLRELYEQSHFLLQVAWTEGFPQTIVEAFGARLPVVATAVGGVPDGVGGAALLVPPGDAAAAAGALRRLAAESELREHLTQEGLALVRENTLERASRRVVDFIAASAA